MSYLTLVAIQFTILNITWFVPVFITGEAKRVHANHEDWTLIANYILIMGFLMLASLMPVVPIIWAMGEWVWTLRYLKRNKK